MADSQQKLDGIDKDLELRLHKAVTHIDSKTGPRIGDNVRIVVTGQVYDSGQKIVGDDTKPYLFVRTETMEVHVG